MAKIKNGKDVILFNIIGYMTITFFGLISVLPFLLIVSGSFTKEEAIMKYGYNIIPKVFSLDAYSFIAESPQTMLKAYAVTILLTLFGTVLALFLMSMMAYVLQRKDFPYRGFLSLFIYFTTLFSGGLVPTYILMIKYLHMKNNYLALLLPLLFNVFNIIIIRSFMSSLPESISESAKIDGAGDFRIFVQLILPLSKPALATIGLFTALGYWNDWIHAMLYIQRENMFPLQYYLYRVLSRIDFLKSIASTSANVNVDVPAESFKLAMTVVTTGPIILLYPSLQKYFIQGLTVGSVKG